MCCKHGPTSISPIYSQSPVSSVPEFGPLNSTSFSCSFTRTQNEFTWEYLRAFQSAHLKAPSSNFSPIPLKLLVSHTPARVLPQPTPPSQLLPALATSALRPCISLLPPHAPSLRSLAPHRFPPLQESSSNEELVEKLEPEDEQLWEKVGILKAIKASIFAIKRDLRLTLKCKGTWSNVLVSYLFLLAFLIPN